MRKLSVLLILTALALGGAYFTWPEQVMARWNAFRVLAEKQLRIELATLEHIQAGKIKIGAAAEPAPQTKPSVVLVPAPPSRAAAKPAKPPQQHRPQAPAPLKAAISPAPTPAVSPPTQDAASTAPPVPGTPEAAMGAILKREVRENQVKEETFWTEERIQEAIKNGPPSSRSAPCIAFCDKNDTTIEINMPKAPDAAP